MNRKAIYVILAAAALYPFGATAQENKDFAIKATADIGLGSALSTDFTLPEISSTTSSTGFGVDFGWTFWRKNKHSLEANIGIGYASNSLTADLSKLDYSYAAPKSADMDDETYIRYYDIKNLHQKISAPRLTLPIYLNYSYGVSSAVNLHALLGVKLGFGLSTSVSDARGDSYSYGVYPQYDDLMIDASYLNEFGATDLAAAPVLKPSTSGVTASLLAGIGAEVRIWGPLSADLSLRYECGMNNLFKAATAEATTTASNAIVTYTVADGQQTKPLSDYLSKSKISRLGLGISLIYRF